MQITKGFNKLLNIKQEEQLAVYLLLLQTFFLGVFLAVFDISATSMFMNTFGEVKLSEAFLISGIIGFSLTALYSKLQSVIKFSKLIILNLLVISILTFMLRFSFYFSNSEWLIFGVFVMMGPLNLLGIVGFWGMAGRLFTLRQGKRLYGLIDSGQIVGMIIISFSIPLILSLLPDSRDLLFLSAGSVFIAFILQIIIVKKFDLNKHNITKGSKAEKQQSVKSLFKNKYVVYMSLFVILSMMAAFFMFYTFLPITKGKYPVDNEFTAFLANFTGALMIFSLLIKTFAYEKLTKAYGLKVNLVIPAIVLGLFTLLAIIVGSVFGFNIESTSFMLFLLLISLGRLFSVSLKGAIEVPSQKILYQSLDVNIRHKVQVIIDGMVNELAAILSGVVLLLLSLISFLDIIHYSYFLFGIVVVWFFVGVKLYREYRISLEVTLNKEKNTDDKDINKEDILLRNINKNIYDNEFSVAIKLIDYAKELEPLNYSKYYINCLEHSNDKFKLEVLKRISSENLYELTSSLNDYVKRESNKENISETKKILKRFDDNLLLLNDNKRLNELVYSVYSEERVLVANLLSKANNVEQLKFLVVLLRDLSSDVKIAAINSAAIQKDKSFIPLLLDLLSVTKYSVYSFEALKKYGELAIAQLEQHFFKSGLDAKVQVQIIKLLGAIGSKESIKYLFNKLNYYNKNIVNEACKALKECGYVSENENDKQQLLQHLNDIIKLTAWNINILVNTNENEIGTAISKVIKTEIKSNYDTLFLVLSITYNPSSVEHVRENLVTDTAESISFALELLDIFVDETIKNLLFILFEDISNPERIRRFKDHFPLDKLTSVELLNSVINRDNNLITRWTKATAISSLNNIEKIKIDDNILAQVFNTDKLLSELAAEILFKNDIELFDTCLSRLDKQIKNEFNNIFNNNPENLIFNRITKLKDFNVFSSISGNLLVELFEKSKEVVIKNGEKTELNNVYNSLIIVSEGIVSTTINSVEHNYFESDIIKIDYNTKHLPVHIKSESGGRILIINSSVLTQYILFSPELKAVLIEIV